MSVWFGYVMSFKEAGVQEEHEKELDQRLAELLDRYYVEGDMRSAGPVSHSGAPVLGVSSAQVSDRRRASTLGSPVRRRAQAAGRRVGALGDAAVPAVAEAGSLERWLSSAGVVAGLSMCGAVAGPEPRQRRPGGGTGVRAAAVP